jgi:hypothetical protein
VAKIIDSFGNFMLVKCVPCGMKFFRLDYWGILLFALVIHSCSSSKKLGETKSFSPKTPEDAWRISERMYPIPEWLVIKGSVEAEGQGLPNLGDLGMTCILRKDSFVWISVKKFGFEGARAWIFQDTATVINRMDKTLQRVGTKAFLEGQGIPGGLPELQRILMGQIPLSPGEKTPFSLGTAPDKDLNSPYAFGYKQGFPQGKLGAYLTKEGLVDSMGYEPLKAGKTLSMKNSKFSQLNQRNFSFQRNILVLEGRDLFLQAEMTIREASLEPKPVTFTLPEGYKRI